MPSAPDVANALITWTKSVIPEIASSFAYPKEEDPDKFPELAIDLHRIDSVRDLQAHYPRKRFDAVLSIVVEPEPYQASAQSVWSMAERLIDAQRNDRTLGISLHGIPMYSGPVTCELPGVITWPEGTKARALTATVQVTTQAA